MSTHAMQVKPQALSKLYLLAYHRPSQDSKQNHAEMYSSVGQEEERLNSP